MSRFPGSSTSRIATDAFASGAPVVVGATGVSPVHAVSSSPAEATTADTARATRSRPERRMEILTLWGRYPSLGSTGPCQRRQAPAEVRRKLLLDVVPGGDG